MSSKHRSMPSKFLRIELDSRVRDLPPPEFNLVYDRIDLDPALPHSRRVIVRRALLSAAIAVCTIAGVSIPTISRNRAYRTEVASFVANLYSVSVENEVASSGEPFTFLFDSWNLLSVDID